MKDSTDSPTVHVEMDRPYSADLPRLRDSMGRLLPGQPAINPAGRRPGSRKVRTLARSYTKEAVEVLVDVMRHSTSSEARSRAAIALLDRGWGRPAQQVRAEVSGAPNIVVQLGWLAGRGVADRSPAVPESITSEFGDELPKSA